MTFLPTSIVSVSTARVSSGISVGQTTAVVLAAANPDRTHFQCVVDDDNNGKKVWVRLYPAADDNEKRGVISFEKEKGSAQFIMAGHIYTGEISAISEDDTNQIYVTEY